MQGSRFSDVRSDGGCRMGFIAGGARSRHHLALFHSLSTTLSAPETLKLLQIACQKHSCAAIHFLWGHDSRKLSFRRWLHQFPTLHAFLMHLGIESRFRKDRKRKKCNRYIGGPGSLKVQSRYSKCNCFRPSCT
jgi:hypothetical protein